MRRLVSERGVVSVFRNVGRVAAEELSTDLRRLAGELARQDDAAQLSDAHRLAIRRNADLKHVHRGERAFVIGNGPSLRDQELTPLSREVTYVGNAFWRHPVTLRADWYPNYYCFIDRGFFDGGAGTIDFFQELRKRCEGSSYIVRTGLLDAVRDADLLDLDSIIPVAVGGQMTRIGLREIDLTDVLPAVHSVLVLQLMCAVYMGCSPIYVLGADHDWLASGYEEPHFYDGKTLPHLKVGHENAVRSRYRSTIEFCRGLWEEHEMVYRVARETGIEIYNATDGGFLDVYPRASLEELFD